MTSVSTEEPSNVTTTEPPFQDDDGKYLIVPLVVIVFVMLLSLFVYCMAKRRKMDKLRRDVARLYHFDQKDLERESLYSQEHSYYGSGNQTPPFMNEGEDIMPTTNL